MCCALPGLEARDLGEWVGGVGFWWYIHIYVFIDRCVSACVHVFI